MLSSLSSTVQFFLKAANDLRALKAPNNSNSFMWRLASSCDQVIPVRSPLHSAPQPESDASAQIDMTGSDSNID